MKLKTMPLIVASMAATPLVLWFGGVAALDAVELTPIEELGKNVFFDTSLSTPGNKQGCVSCHDPAIGWTFPDSAVNKGQVVAPGAAPHALGNIRTPTNAYASFIAPFQECAFGAPGAGGHCGGVFWDGRAEGNGKLNDGHGALPAGDGAVSETITVDDLPPVTDADDPTGTRHGKYLGPVADQALNPFPNTVEQNIREKKVCQKVKTAKYKALYQEAFGEPIDCRKKPKDNPAYRTSFKRIAVALAAYQASPDVNSFTSKRDIALRQELACMTEEDLEDRYPGEDAAEIVAPYFNQKFCEDLVDEKGADPATWGKFPLMAFTDEENLGHDLFYNTALPFGPNPSPPPFPLLPVTQCSFCHVSDEAHPDGTGFEERYADDSYHNIGTPFNPEIPGVAKGEKIGIAAHLTTAGPGFVKAPTIRNTGKGADDGFIKAYGNNGYFKSLESIVHFYSTRDLKDACEIPSIGIIDATEAEALEYNCWPEAEFPGTQSPPFLVGNIGLTSDQEAALVDYMRTLSDEYTPEKP